ncbi:hypothetical protein ACFY8C_09955 [Streptomyces flavochromogenes]|uniref:Uncharacterized protein n=1 Tax=Streptomyces flavochromogenes TaxID=68199 RepID=A0ABW6XME9_9ACTN|nr:hypothetical protein [Streptomyces flavochromogenes]
MTHTTSTWSPQVTDRVAPLLETVSTTSRSAVLVAGGYFDTAAGIGAFSLNSFALAQETGAAARRLHRGNKVLYDVIVNDLGMSCATDVCALPAAAGPAGIDLSPLTASAAGAGISFTVTRERNLRNRAARSMKRWLRDPAARPLFTREGDEIVFRSRQYEKVLAGVVTDGHVVPRCPLIVAEYFARYFARLRRAFPDCAHRHVVDINSLADRDKVTKGAEIYLRTHGTPEEEIVLVFADPSCVDPLALTYTAYDF